MARNGTMQRTLLAFGLSIGLLADMAMAAQPNLGSITPRGGQRGATAEIFFNGARLADAKEIFFYYPGFTVTKFEVVNDNQVKVTATIAPDCRLGEHAMRVRTATGISEMQTYYVGPYPSVSEKEPNSEFATPQAIPMNVTVHGVADNEDVDYFVIDAKKGQRITAEVEGMRLGNTLFDPYVAILDMGRFELAFSDDSALVWQDGVASTIAPKDGKYIVMVRETSYGGNGACMYRLHVGNFPRPTGVFPAGGKLGEELTVKFLGDPAGEIAQKFPLPKVADTRFGVACAENGLISPSANLLRVSPFGNALEVEPNEELKTASPSAEALPIAFNGVIGKKGDVDFFKFKAKPGTVYDVHCYARRLRSPLDPVIYIYNAQGGALVANDDAIGPDSFMQFQAPADGEYYLQVFDHLKKGGADYFYRVEMTPVAPSVSLTIPEVGLYSQERQTIYVPKGNRSVAMVVANRANFGGDLVLGANNLPAGMKVSSENMLANLSVIPVLFEADANSAPAGALAELFAKPVDPKINATSSFATQIEFVIGQNQTIMWQHTVDKLAVAVTEEAPFKVNIVEPKAPLVQDGTMNLKVVVERKPGFKAPIHLEFPFRPPGVGAAAGVDIPEGQSEAYYPINANGGAQPRVWKVVVQAAATVGNGTVWISSQLANLEIATPYVGLAIQMAAAEQGKPTDVVCKLEQRTPFDGKAKVVLQGLPANTASKEMEITKDQKEVVFPVTVAANSPVGQHKSLFCQLTVIKNGEPVIHNLGGGGTLRIDPPPPPKKDPAPMPTPTPQPAAVAAAPAQPAKVERRLTRLEQLRLEQAERAKAGGK